MLGLLPGDDLTRARRAAARGRVKAALRHAWSAGIRAHGRADEATLAEVVALLDELARDAGEDVAQDVGQARAFCSACLADLRAGKRPPSLIEKIIRGGNVSSRRREKVCPDCAEKVLQDARVCRFCGYRFDGGGEAGG